MKKILALVLAFVLVLVPMTMSVSAADGDDAATLTVGTSADVAANDPIAIDVAVATEAQDGIAGAQFEIALGDLVYVGTTADAESIVYTAATNTVKFVDASLDGMGDLFTINVTVPADAEAGTTYTPAVSNVVLCKENEELFAVTSNVATYTVPSQQAVEAVLDPALRFDTTPVSINATLGMGFMVVTADMAAYDHYDFVITKQKYDTNEYNEYTAESEIVIPDQTMGNWTYGTIEGISLYELGLDINAYIRCYDADNNYVAYSNVTTVTPVDALKELYNNNDPATTTNTKTKTKRTNTRKAVTDLINLGAKAQAYFGGRKDGSDLSKATLINTGFPQTYASTTLGTMNTVNSLSWKNNQSTLTSTTNKMTVAAALTTAPVVGYLIADKTKSLDPNKLEIECSYTSLYPETAVISDSVNGDIADSTNLSTGNKWEYMNGSWVCYFSKTTLFDGNKTVTATLKYDGKVAATSEYSVDTYVNANKTKTGALGDLLRAVGMFGASIRVYFGTN